MANLNTNFNPEAVESGGDFSPIPAGEYLAQIVSSEVVTPKSGQGLMLKLRLDIMDGPFERRVIFDQINYQHANPTAQLIGQQRLKAICEAVGHAGPLGDSEDLHYKPMRIRVVIKRDEAYGDKNEVKGFRPAYDSPPQSKPAGGYAQQPQAAAQAQPRQQQAPPSAAPAPGQTRPWGNRTAGAR
ncbi:DUF669 domain-containing protein [Chelatococcus reniformis]|uniref:DUF669 domain-containing protein n=1 Tax=Chelatococcus reniformis TaxID=1494448 RepID=A0A916XFI7_9HYPH|nr:DUF669 domain-containing protein [Chelatococcus reniformis]GGC68405.1 hypothetical protein GCM10010994_28710 [Chelatococcus reniformis]